MAAATSLRRLHTPDSVAFLPFYPTRAYISLCSKNLRFTSLGEVIVRKRITSSIVSYRDPIKFVSHIDNIIGGVLDRRENR